MKWTFSGQHEKGGSLVADQHEKWGALVADLYKKNGLFSDCKFVDIVNISLLA